MFSLRYCRDIVNWLFLVLWACLPMHIQSDTIVLQETFVFICRQKINFIRHTFVQILQRYANLFWVLWTCQFPLTQNDSIILQKTSIFICMQNMNCIIHLNCIIHFFLSILHFKESCNLIGWRHFGHNSRPKILPDMLVKCESQHQLSIQIISKKN